LLSLLQRSSRAAPAIVALMAAKLICTPAYGYDRDKSDVVELRNGNHLSGDIVSMEYGTLSLKTDEMGTLHIEWPAVRSVSARCAVARGRCALR